MGPILSTISMLHAQRRIEFIVLICIVAAYGIVAHQRNVVWKSKHSVWSDAVKKSPTNARAHYNLGKAYGELGRFREEFEQYQEAIRINPRFARAHYNIGVLFGKMGNYHEELQAYKRAIRFKPDYAKAYCNLGVAYAQMGFYPKAISAFEEAVG